MPRKSMLTKGMDQIEDTMPKPSAKAMRIPKSAPKAKPKPVPAKNIYEHIDGM